MPGPEERHTGFTDSDSDGEVRHPPRHDSDDGHAQTNGGRPSTSTFASNAPLQPPPPAMPSYTTTAIPLGMSANTPPTTYKHYTTMASDRNGSGVTFPLEKGPTAPYNRIDDTTYTNEKTSWQSPTSSIGSNHPYSKSKPTASRMSSFAANLLPKTKDPLMNFSTANSSVENLQFAEGDAGRSWFSKAYYYLIQKNIVVRWALFILPVVALFWIPAIVELTAAPRAAVWHVRLLFWSIWLTVTWCVWWGAFAVTGILPTLFKNTLGMLMPQSMRYVGYLQRLRRYITFFVWCLVTWISFNLLINKRTTSTTGNSKSTLALITKVLFGLMICAAIWLGEKLLVQIIAWNFHQTSFADRIEKQKFAVRTLTTLYVRSRKVGVNDDESEHEPTIRPTKILRRVAKGARNIAQTGATALGNVASEIAGSSVLQPNSPASRVMYALASPTKTRQLARRLFISFRHPDRQSIFLDDLVGYFKDLDTAKQAFAVLDQDENGDVSMDEMEAVCMELHRERLALEASLRDIDSAAGRLDAILSALVFLISALIIAAMANAQFSTLVTSAGAFVLGLSWLIGTTAQEVILSIIFVFCKHPYDVGDKVTINTETYFVQTINLLSTTFRRIDGIIVQAPHTLLNGQFIQNARRAGPTSETFLFDVAFGTTFEQIEQLRTMMLDWVTQERRDYQPAVDINVVDFSEQSKLSLSVDIKHKTNFQNGALKVQRSVKFKCALKACLAELKIFGPGGDPNAVADPAKYMQVPYVAPEDKSDDEEPPEKDGPKDRDILQHNRQGEMAFHFTDQKVARTGGDNVAEEAALQASQQQSAFESMEKEEREQRLLQRASTRRNKKKKDEEAAIELKPGLKRLG